MPKDKKWKKFELLAKEIQQQLSPEALVEHDVKIPGKSGGLRQIDISVRQRVGQFDLFIAIDCKDYNKKLDVKHVEEFAGLVQDVGAYKGAMISFLGFTETAKNRAGLYGIDLYRLVDTESDDWKVELTIPVYYQEKTVEKWSLSIRSNYNAPLVIPSVDVRHLAFYDESHQLIGISERYFKEKWNKGDLGTTAGTNDFKLDKVYISDGVGYYPCDICFTYDVFERFHVIKWRISDLKGFVDEKSGRIITRQFAINGDLDLKEIERKWKDIKKIEPDDRNILVFEVINLFGL